MTRKLWQFPGGLRLQGHKGLSTGQPIEALPIARELIIPLRQHIGEAPELLVQVGERVLAGQMLARPTGYVSASIHAPSSGTVTAIESRRVPHPSGLTAECVVIETDGRDDWAALPVPLPHYAELDPAEIRTRVRESGIVGLGGAAFPSAVKLNPGPDAVVEELILNGAECEPYITCDDMLMRERAVEVIEGLRIMRHAIKPKRCLIGIEDNKPEAYQALLAALQEQGETGVEVVQVPTRYPAGGEKQLIYTLTGKEVPSHGLPVEIGVTCHNVGTAVAVYQAVVHGRPLISRIVTITGRGVAEPRNLEVRLGTPIHALIRHCGGYTEAMERLLMGGPMMGFALQDDDIPVVKATNCVLAADGEHFPAPQPAMPCIRCGACTDACPVSLLPQQLYWFSRAKDFERAQEHSLFDCIECGACAYVCPSHIPLVQYFRYGKSEVWAAERERRRADVARDRHEFRQFRLEREKEEQAEKRRKKKEALKKGGDEDKKAAIEAALARAKKKKAEQAESVDEG